MFMRRPLVSLAVAFAVIVAVAAALLTVANQQAMRVATDTPAEPGPEIARTPPDGSAGAPVSGPAPNKDIEEDQQLAAVGSQETISQTAPSFDVVRVEPTGEALIAGRAPPGAEIEILSADMVIARVTADAEGAFLATPEAVLPPGEHRLSVRLAGENGPSPAGQQAAVTVPQAGAAGSETVADSDGSATAARQQVTETDAAAPDVVASAENIIQPAPTVSGGSGPGADSAGGTGSGSAAPAGESGASADPPGAADPDSQNALEGQGGGGPGGGPDGDAQEAARSSLDARKPDATATVPDGLTGDAALSAAGIVAADKSTGGPSAGAGSATLDGAAGTSGPPEQSEGAPAPPASSGSGRGDDAGSAANAAAGVDATAEAGPAPVAGGTPTGAAAGSPVTGAQSATASETELPPGADDAAQGAASGGADEDDGPAPSGPVATTDAQSGPGTLAEARPEEPAAGSSGTSLVDGPAAPTASPAGAELSPGSAAGQASGAAAGEATTGEAAADTIAEARPEEPAAGRSDVNPVDGPAAPTASPAGAELSPGSAAGQASGAAAGEATTGEAAADTIAEARPEEPAAGSSDVNPVDGPAAPATSPLGAEPSPGRAAGQAGGAAAGIDGSGQPAPAATGSDPRDNAAGQADGSDDARDTDPGSPAGSDIAAAQIDTPVGTDSSTTADPASAVDANAPPSARTEVETALPTAGEADAMSGAAAGVRPGESVTSAVDPSAANLPAEPEPPPITLGEAESAATSAGPAESIARAPTPVLAIKAAEAEARTLYVAGEAAPGTLVRIYADEELVGEAEANAEGSWLLEAARDVPLGDVEIRADAVAANAAVPGEQVAVPFTRFADGIVLEPVAAAVGGEQEIAAAVARPPTTYVIIRRGDNLWRISRRNYGRGIRYEAIFAANRDQIRNPNRIYPGQVFIMPTRDRTWETAIN